MSVGFVLLIAVHITISEAVIAYQAQLTTAKAACRMTDNKFEQRREAVLDAISCGADRSKKGSFDTPIADMLCHLNNSTDFVSTSSCSGRVALFWESSARGEADKFPDDVDDDSASVQGSRKRAKGGQWLLCKHGTVTLEEVESALQKASSDPGIAFFKHEPFVLHVQCRNVEAACQLMEVARSAGFRESGISIGKKHIIVGIRTSSLKIEAPVHENGRMLVTKDYLQVLVRLANDKFVKNREKTDRFYILLRQSLLQSVPVPDELLDGGGGGGEPSRETATLGSDEGAGGPWAMTCLPTECEHVRGLLLQSSWLDKTRRNLKLPTARMAIPVTPACAAALRGPGDPPSSGVAQQSLAEMVATGAISVEAAPDLPPAGKTSRPSPAAALASALAELLAAHRVRGAEAALRGVPRKWEEYGDLVLLPEGSLQGGAWAGVEQRALWGAVAAALGAGRVACKAEVDAGQMRESHVKVLHPEGASGWVTVVQHGVSYSMDITRVMFSRGNVNERRRMGKVAAQGQTVVDLFAGVGYFTVPLLVSGGAQHLFACEWNPASVEALKQNLRANKVSDRCTVLEGDNREQADRLAGCADRVLLGLLPSSEGAWGLAVRCLRAEGGWLHVHENVSEADMEGWKARLTREVEREAGEAGRAWAVEIRHVEFVKTYAPRVWHVVVDLYCSPA